MAQKIVRVFLNVDMRNGHDGLASVARDYDISVDTLSAGEYLVFINSRRNKMKVYAVNNVVAYMKTDKSVIDLNAVRYVPEAFTAEGELNYSKALARSVEESLQRSNKSVYVC